MALDFTVGSGLEEIQTQAFLTLREYLNDAILNEETEGQTRDATLASERSVVYQQITLEPIAEGNFHWGHRPSLIEAPIDEYPNVSVMAQNASPAASQADQGEDFEVLVVVEVMVKSPSADPRNRAALHACEEVVNKRIQRVTNAVVAVLGDHPTLDGSALPLRVPPLVIVTDAFLRRAETGHGPVWLWQGSRLEFSYEKHASY